MLFTSFLTKMDVVSVMQRSSRMRATEAPTVPVNPSRQRFVIHSKFVGAHFARNPGLGKAGKAIFAE